MLLVTSQVVHLEVPVEPLRHELLEHFAETGKKGDGAVILHLGLLSIILEKGGGICGISV